jgi:putative protease
MKAKTKKRIKAKPIKKVVAKKKIAKKIALKKKATPKKGVKKVVVKEKKMKAIGVVTHFFNHIDVAIVKFKRPIKVGENIRFKGATTDFEEKIKSMQYNHKAIVVAKKGQEVGIKVGDKVREGDVAYEV